MTTSMEEELISNVSATKVLVEMLDKKLDAHISGSKNSLNNVPIWITAIGGLGLALGAIFKK